MAHRRWKRREFASPVAEFGESVMYLPTASVGKNKFDVRWEDGVWLGVKMGSGESTIGAANRVVKATDFRRKPEEGGRWSTVGAVPRSRRRIRDQVESQTSSG